MTLEEFKQLTEDLPDDAELLTCGGETRSLYVTQGQDAVSVDSEPPNSFLDADHGHEVRYGDTAGIDAPKDSPGQLMLF